MSAELIDVVVCYALPERQWLLPVRVPAGSSVAAAIEQSGIREWIPEDGVDGRRVGIFGKPCSLDTPLRSGDRVELYRGLLCDPKEIRRQRAEADRQAPDRPPQRP